jgi:hypothetical protein
MLEYPYERRRNHADDQPADSPGLSQDQQVLLENTVASIEAIALDIATRPLELRPELLSLARKAYLEGFRMNSADDALAVRWTATMMAAIQKLLAQMDQSGSGNA